MRPIREPNGQERSDVRGELPVMQRFSAADIASMTMEDYARIRPLLLQAASEPTQEYIKSRRKRKKAEKAAREMDNSIVQKEIAGMMTTYMEFNPRDVPDNLSEKVMENVYRAVKERR